MTKNQLEQILDKLESKYPSIEKIYKDLDKFWNDLRKLLGKGCGTDVDYLTYDIDNDTYKPDTAFEEVINYIQQSEQNGKLVKAYTTRFIDSMLILLISYK